MFLNWTGRGIPRTYCQLCRDYVQKDNPVEVIEQRGGNATDCASINIVSDELIFVENA